MPAFRTPGHHSADTATPIDSGTSARTNSPVPNFFGRTLKNSLYHEYEHKTKLCKSTQFNQEATFQLLLSNATYVAPTDDARPVVNGMKVNVYLALLGVRFSEGNPIRVTINAKNYSVTNTTLQGHMLHPGSVTRRIVVVHSDIVIHTKGVGTGIAQGSLNYVFCSPLLDRILPRQDTPSGIANNLAAADVWGDVDATFKEKLDSIIFIKPGGGSSSGGGVTGRWGTPKHK